VSVFIKDNEDKEALEVLLSNISLFISYISFFLTLPSSEELADDLVKDLTLLLYI